MNRDHDTVERVGERPKLVSYGDYVFFIFYGAWRAPAGDSSPLYEVDLFISGKYLITIHSSELPPLAKQRDELAGRALHSEQFLIYRVLDALTDSFFPILSDMENDIDDLEAEVLTHPTERQLERVFALKRQLVAMNKVVTPQRDVFARSIDELGEIPGLVLDERDYFHAVYDHLILIGELIDSCRDLLSSVTDLYLSTTSNRQNDVMKQLTLVATIFLPLAFITGFFGQNFDWMVSAVHRGWAFWAFGIGSLILTCVGLLAFFRRKGWM
jgi:magnesium transporter